MTVSDPIVKLRPLFWTALAALLTLMLLEIVPVFDPVERAFYDLRVTRLEPSAPWPTELVRVTIDDDSIRREGMWPWPREKTALLLRRLDDLGAKTIAVDLTFGTNSGEAADRALAGSLSRAVIAVGWANDPIGSETGEGLSRALVPTGPVWERVSAKNLIVPVEPMASGARALGHIASFDEGEGVHRRHVPLLGVAGKDGSLPSLALASWLLQHDLDPAAVKATARTLTLPDGRTIPLDDGEMWIDFGPAAAPSPRVSAADVVEGTGLDAIRDVLAGKLALVFVDSTYAVDDVLTPLGRTRGGEVLARDLRTISSGRPPRPGSAAGAVAALALVAALVSMPLSKRPPEWIAGWVGAVAIAWFGASLALVPIARLFLPIAAPLFFLLTFGGLLLASSSRELVEERRRLRSLLEAARAGAPATSADPDSDVPTQVRPVTAGSEPTPRMTPRSVGTEALVGGTTLDRPVQIGRYVVQRTIGRGGMGAIFYAMDKDLQRPVALKILEAADPASFVRFRQEAMAVARISHPNVVQIFEVGLDARVPYIIMEYVAGGTLADLLREHQHTNPPDWKRSARIIAGVARGLGAAHVQGIVHRDVKPTNLLLTDPEGDVAKVADFGIAKLSGGEQVTREGSFVGTIGYLSPEQALGMAVDARSDVYSLALTWYRLLTGRRAFEGSTAQVLRASVSQPLPDPAIHNRDLPEEVSALVRRMASLERAERPKDGNEAAAEIEALLARHEITKRA